MFIRDGIECTYTCIYTYGTPTTKATIHKPNECEVEYTIFKRNKLFN